MRRTETQPAGIERDALPAGSIAGHAVLFHTGWDRHWGTDTYGTGAPYLTADLVAALVERDVAVAGIDSVNIDDVADGNRPAHSQLLGNGIPIVEHLTNWARSPTADACSSQCHRKCAGSARSPYAPSPCAIDR